MSDEIEITDEMISAGVRAASLFNPGEDDPEVMVRQIFIEMEAARYRTAPEALP